MLLIFQAMDAAGKDGAIRHVMSGVNPQGCQVFSFKHPSADELQHDFLWRTTRDLPERGRIGIFNRSYYEEVLIVRVHPEILRSEGLPDAPLDEKTVWHDRYRSITDLERHLHGNGTRIIKFYPPPVQGGAAQALPAAHRRAGKELEIQPRRHRGAEILEAVHEGLRGMPQRDQHQRRALVCRSRRRQGERRLIVSQIVLDTLEGLKMTYPKTSAERRRELLSIRRAAREMRWIPLSNVVPALVIALISLAWISRTDRQGCDQFTLPRRRKASPFFCNAKCGSWASASLRCAEQQCRYRSNNGH